jgi:hypothetical protein
MKIAARFSLTRDYTDAELIRVLSSPAKTVYLDDLLAFSEGLRSKKLL